MEGTTRIRISMSKPCTNGYGRTVTNNWTRSNISSIVAVVECNNEDDTSSYLSGNLQYMLNVSSLIEVIRE